MNTITINFKHSGVTLPFCDVIPTKSLRKYVSKANKLKPVQQYMLAEILRDQFCNGCDNEELPLFLEFTIRDLRKNRWALFNNPAEVKDCYSSFTATDGRAIGRLHMWAW